MTSVINLRRYKKQKARQSARAAGDSAAAGHGVSKADRTKAEALREKARKQLDGVKRERPHE